MCNAMPILPIYFMEHDIIVCVRSGEKITALIHPAVLTGVSLPTIHKLYICQEATTAILHECSKKSFTANIINDTPS